MGVSVILYSPHDQQTRTDVLVIFFLVGLSLLAALVSRSPRKLWRAVRGIKSRRQQWQPDDWSIIALAD
jgi:hypothetical protein